MGLLGGSLAGLIITRERKGFGLARNMGLGLAGAIIGGLLFRLLGLLSGLDQISISLRDVVAAFVGSLIVLAAIGINARHREKAKKSRVVTSSSVLASPATRRPPPKCRALRPHPRGACAGTMRGACRKICPAMASGVNTAELD